MDAVNRPVTTMLQRWIYEGELEDPDGEFFVADAGAALKIEHFWEKKYSIRESMLPSFMQRDLCDKILLIGKSINYIRKVLEIPEPLLNNAPELHSYGGFALHDNRVLRPIVDEVYQVVSAHAHATCTRTCTCTCSRRSSTRVCEAGAWMVEQAGRAASSATSVRRLYVDLPHLHGVRAVPQIA